MRDIDLAPGLCGLVGKHARGRRISSPEGWPQNRYSMSDLIWNFSSLVVGSFIGAFFAFEFERWQRRREERSDHYLAVKYAHFVLLQQWSLLRNLATQHLDALVGNENRWWMLRPIQSPPKSFSIDFNSLAFVLRSKDPDLLNRLAVTQDRFSTLTDLLDQRSRLHSQFQDRTAALDSEGAFPGGRFVLDQQTAKKIGQALLAQLRETTNELFESVPAAREFLTARLKELEEFIREEFPKERPPSYRELPLNEAGGGG